MNQKYIMAVRIYYGMYFTPMADLRMNDESVETIQWTDAKEYSKAIKMLNGYTVIYDERQKMPWREWLK